MSFYHDYINYDFCIVSNYGQGFISFQQISTHPLNETGNYTYMRPAIIKFWINILGQWILMAVGQARVVDLLDKVHYEMQDSIVAVTMFMKLYDHQ